MLGYFYSFGSVDAMFFHWVLPDLRLTISIHITFYRTQYLVTHIAWVATAVTGKWTRRIDQVWPMRDLYARLVFIDFSLSVAEIERLTAAIANKYCNMMSDEIK